MADTATSFRPPLYTVTALRLRALWARDPLLTSDPVWAACRYLEADRPGLVHAQLHATFDHIAWQPYRPADLLNDAQRATAAPPHRPNDPPQRLQRILEEAQARWLEQHLPDNTAPATRAPWTRAGRLWASTFDSTPHTDVLNLLEIRNPGSARAIAALRQAADEFTTAMAAVQEQAAGRSQRPAAAVERTWRLLRSTGSASGGQAAAATRWLAEHELGRHPRTAPLLEARPDLADRIRDTAARLLDPALLFNAAHPATLSEDLWGWNAFERAARALLAETPAAPTRPPTVPPVHQGATAWRSRVPAAQRGADRAHNRALWNWRAAVASDNNPSPAGGTAAAAAGAARAHERDLHHLDQEHAVLEALAAFADAAQDPGTDTAALAAHAHTAKAALARITEDPHDPSTQHQLAERLRTAAGATPQALAQAENLAREADRAAAEPPAQTPSTTAAWGAPAADAPSPEHHRARRLHREHQDLVRAADDVTRALDALPAALSLAATHPDHAPPAPSAQQATADHARALYAVQYPPTPVPPAPGHRPRPRPQPAQRAATRPPTLSAPRLLP